MLSLDICMKNHLLAYGGKGYAYLQRRFLPQLTVINPQRGLGVQRVEG